MTKVSLPQQWLTLETQMLYVNDISIKLGGKVYRSESIHQQNKEEKAYNHLTVDKIHLFTLKNLKLRIVRNFIY